MKSTSKFVFLFLFSAFVVSSIYAGGDKDKARKKIEEANKKMAEDMVNGNYQACLDLYTEDAINMPSFSEMNRGRAEIEEQYNKDKDMGKVTEADFETVEVYGEGDLFVEIGKYNMTIDLANMEEPFTDKGKYVTVWKQMPDGSMKIQADIWNTDTNYMEQQMAGESKTDEMTGGKKED